MKVRGSEKILEVGKHSLHYVNDTVSDEWIRPASERNRNRSSERFYWDQVSIPTVTILVEIHINENTGAGAHGSIANYRTIETFGPADGLLAIERFRELVS